MGIWVGRYAIVDGEAQEHGPWLVERRRARDDTPVRLVVLAEPADARSAPFCREVAAAVAELFARESLSVTGGMLRALQQAHDNLAEWNRRSLREHRVAVGVSCVAVRGSEATIAQVGPGVIYIGSPGGVQRLVAEGEAARPMGGSDPVEPVFHRADLRAQSVLLLSRAGEAAAGPMGVGAALGAGPERALAELFMQTRAATDMAAALIAEIDGVEETDPDPFSGDYDDAGPGAAFDAAAVAPRVRGTAADVAARATADPTVDPTAGEAWDDAGDDGAPGVTLLGGEPPPFAVDSGGRGAGGRPVGGRAVGGRAVGGRATGGGPAGGRAAGGRSVPGGRRGGGGLPALRRPRVAGAGGGSPSWRPWALGAAVAAVVVLLLWFTVPGLLDEDREAQLTDALDAAVSAITRAEAATETADRRALVDEALTELARARSVATDDPRIAALETRAEGVLDALDAITELEDPLVVLPFDGVMTAPFDPAALRFGGGGLWLLDGGGGRVFAVDPAGTEPQRAATEVYRAGEVYDGAAAREPLGIAWDEQAQRLLILDAARTLFEVTRTVDGPSDPAVVPLRAAEDLRSVADIAVYDGNLYLLDPEGGEVWRYLPAGGGFDSERSGLLGRAEIADARRLFVDGDVFVLAPAAVRRFVRGAEAAALFAGIDRPPEGAAALAGGPGGRLFVADRGNRRVIVTERDGAFVRQYMHPDLFDLRGLAMPPGGDFLYALTADAIVEFPLSAGSAAPASTPTPDPTSVTDDAEDAP